MSKNTLLNIYVASTLLVSGLGLALMAFWLLYPYEPFTFYSDHNHTLQETYYPGDTVQWRSHFKHNTTGKLVQVDRQLVDGIVINYASTNYVSDGQEKDFINASMRLPDFISPGQYHIEIVNTVHVNPMRDVIVVRRTNDFVILPKP